MLLDSYQYPNGTVTYAKKCEVGRIDQTAGEYERCAPSPQLTLRREVDGGPGLGSSRSSCMTAACFWQAVKGL
jgi:hypothetical protein